MKNDCVDFMALSSYERREVIVAALQACANQWGDECCPAIDRGDERLFYMPQIVQAVLDGVI